MIRTKARVAVALALVATAFVARPAAPVFASCDNSSYVLAWTDTNITDTSNGHLLGDVQLYYIHCDSGDWYHGDTGSNIPGVSITSIDQEIIANTAGPQTFPGGGFVDSPGGLYNRGVTLGKGVLSSFWGNGQHTTPAV